MKVSKKNRALLMTAAALRRLDLFPLEACEEAVRRSQGTPIAEESLEALEQSKSV